MLVPLLSHNLFVSACALSFRSSSVPAVNDNMNSLSNANLSLAAFASLCLVSSVISFQNQGKIKKEFDALEEELRQLRQSHNEEQHDTESPAKISDKRSPRETLEKEFSTPEGGLLVKPIGTIRSIYKLCVGTPRQGLLAPNARGCIELKRLGDSSAAGSVSGLEGYSHIWVVFVFHLNTQSKGIKSKIAPPALGGEKVGIFATRSPHRYNPIGITLCKLDRIEVTPKRKHAPSRVILHVSGLDLVDTTPVLDIKPYVPIYDSVQNHENDNKNQQHDGVQLPSWVAGGLATKRKVIITDPARQDLDTILRENPRALQFYGPQQQDENVVGYVLDCIQQVLAMDVRSSFQTKKVRQGKFQAQRAQRLNVAVRNDTTAATTTSTASNTTMNNNAKTEDDEEDVCTQQLDNLLIRYKVEETVNSKRSSSKGSGAEDCIYVISIHLLTQSNKKQ